MMKIKKILILLFFISNTVLAQEYISEAKMKNDVLLRKEASFFSSSNGMKLLKNDKVYVIDFKNNYWLITRDSIKGWCSSNFLYKTDTMYVLKNKYENNENINKFGLNIGKKINAHKIWIGMTKEMLLASYGIPENKNITKLNNSIHEQWIYKSSYIYLDDDIVTAIQE